ncbi:MAG: PorT family protein [Bacteroidales bacterium]|nr:PorT family protein [Bacteroidales bacterium]
MSWRSLFIALVLSVGSFVLYGQIPASFGLKGGISLANQSFRITPIDYELETKALSAPALALFVEAFKGNHFSFQMDVGYVVKGSSTTTQSVTVNHLDNDRIIVNEGDLQVSKFNYLSLSPMARLRAQKGAITPYVLLGPRIDLLLNYNTGSDHPLEEQNSLVVGLSGGVGLEYSLTMAGVFAELQYQPDLSPVTNMEPLLINNNSLVFTVGIRF